MSYLDGYGDYVSHTTLWLPDVSDKVKLPGVNLSRLDSQRKGSMLEKKKN